jgi:hypothetical protein
MRLEVVEFGGASFGEPGATNPRLDELTATFAAVGRTLIPVRPFLGRFPLLPERGQNLQPGRLLDGRQLLFAFHQDNDRLVVFAYFDDEGNLLEAHEADDEGWTSAEDYVPWLAKEFGFTPSVIWMREFRTHQDLGIQLLPDLGIMDGSGDVWDWLFEGSYVINWCNTPWASRRSGEIHTT